MKCKNCGKEIADGLRVCSFCNSDLENSNKEKQMIFPILPGFWAAATAYGIPVVAANVVEKDKKASNAVSAAEVVNKTVAARTLYGMPPISSRFFEDSDCIIEKNEKICNHCKAKIKLDEKICPKCGKKLGFAALYEEDK